MKHLKIYEAFENGGMKTTELFVIYRNGMESPYENMVYTDLKKAEAEAEKINDENLSLIKKEFGKSFFKKDTNIDEYIQKRFPLKYRYEAISLYEAISRIYDYAMESGEDSGFERGSNWDR